MFGPIGRFLFVLPFLILGGWWVWDGIKDIRQHSQWLREIMEK